MAVTSGQAIPPLSYNDRCRFWAKVGFADGRDDCWEWQAGTTGAGYGSFSFGPRKQNQRLLAHRVAYALFKGPIPLPLTISHLCHNRRCVRPKHLVAESIGDNLARSCTGVNHKDARLTEPEVVAIRAAFDEGKATVGQLAKRYGMNVGTISQVTRRLIWRRVPEQGGVPSPN